MQNSLLYSLRIALLASVTVVLLLAATFYASLYVRSLIVESGAAAAVGVIGAFFALLLLVFVATFGIAWSAMLLREHRHTH